MVSQAHAEKRKLLESGLIIGDRIEASSEGGTMVHVNATTGKPQKEFAIASKGEVDEAVAAARAAFDDWRQWQPDQRRHRGDRAQRAEVALEVGRLVAARVLDRFFCPHLALARHFQPGDDDVGEQAGIVATGADRPVGPSRLSVSLF